MLYRQNQRSDCGLTKNATTHCALMHSGQKHVPNGCALTLQAITSSGILSIMPPPAAPVPGILFGEGWMNPGRALFYACVYLGHFHCRESLWACFYVHTRLQIMPCAILRAYSRRDGKKGLVPSSKAWVTNIWSDNKRRYRFSHDNPSAGYHTFFNTWEFCSKTLQTNSTPTLMKNNTTNWSDYVKSIL